MLICDLTQSYSDTGGGVGTYLRHKRAFIRDATPYRHLLILPGEEDAVRSEGRLTTVEIASPPVPGNPQYRLLLRNGKVVEALRRFTPDIVECLDGYNLPWAALRYRSRNPDAALVAAYFTDFPTAYVKRGAAALLGDSGGEAARKLAYRYCSWLFGRFDAVYALGEAGGAASLRAAGISDLFLLPLGVDLQCFSPARRDPRLRERVGVTPNAPLLIYAGRLDVEKRPSVVMEAFRHLPEELGAGLVMLGSGSLRDKLAASAQGLRVHLPGYVKDRAELAAWLASADIYVSAMANETFGLSVVEAQACGLPVVGVDAGAMPERVPPHLGRLGPVGDALAMARNIVEVWQGDMAEMRANARAHVERNFSWNRTFETLFSTIYPAAQRQRALSLNRAGARSPLPQGR